MAGGAAPMTFPVPVREDRVKDSDIEAIARWLYERWRRDWDAAPEQVRDECRVVAREALAGVLDPEADR